MSTSSAEALILYRRDPQRFDLVLTDQTMPQMTGDHLVAKLRRIRKDTPVILMTGFSQTIDEERCAQLGIQRLLMKPRMPNALAQAICDALDEVESRR